MISSVGAAGLLVASLIREKSIFRNLTEKRALTDGRPLLSLYRRNRSLVLSSFVLLFLVVGVVNMELVIYQRGITPQTKLPLGMNGVFTWLLLFGLASVSAVILDCELRIRRSPYLVMSVAMLEAFVSNVSMLSRGMILNAGALILGADASQEARSSRPKARFAAFVAVTFVALFALSVISVNYVRSYRFLADEYTDAGKTRSGYETLKASNYMNIQLIDRWVGMESVMAVAGYPRLGWELWTRAWREKASDTGTSLYDAEIAKSNYVHVESAKHHFISLPGIIAFFYYPGSYAFLFLSMVMLGLTGAVVEFLVYRLSDSNMILSSLIAQVVAYRYAHFGYAPAQSYLLAGAIILNVALIYLFVSFCRRYKGDRADLTERVTA